jgi:hypothetical protein
MLDQPRNPRGLARTISRAVPWRADVSNETRSYCERRSRIRATNIHLFRMRAGVQARSRCQREACAVSGVELATERLATDVRDLSGPTAPALPSVPDAKFWGDYTFDDGIAPSTGGGALKIAIGGLIALAVVGYVASQWKKFD